MEFRDLFWVDGNEAIMSLVSLGFGIGVVPELVLRNCPPTIDVRPLDVHPALPPYSVGLCSRKRRLGHPSPPPSSSFSATID